MTWDGAPVTTAPSLVDAVTLADKVWSERKGTGMPSGGKREGAGRKAVDGVKPTATYLLNLEDEEQKAKLLRLGGAAWVRKKIKTAKEPKPEPKAKP